MANRNKTPKPDLIDKERKALELRRAGATYDEIAQALGYATPQGAFLAYNRAIKRTLVEGGAEEARQSELDRCDRLQRAYWAKAMSGDIQAGGIILKVMDRRARYLGLDAPIKQQVELTSYEGGTEVDRELQRLIALLADGNSKTGVVDSAESPTHTS
jgi:hypothetical protein